MAQGSQNYAMQPYRPQQESGYARIFSPDENTEDAMLTGEVYAVHDADALNSDKMTAKVPPAYDGLSSSFSFKENVEEWQLITIVEENKQAPLIRFRLKGNARAVISLLDIEKLTQPGAVKYLLDTLRPHFVKDRNHVYLWRFLRFFKFTRGNSDITMWIPRYQIMFHKVVDSWMDILDLAKGYNEGLRTNHSQKFPINDHLMVLMFTVAFDLTEFQRRDITSILTQRGIKMQDYTFELISEVFRDLLCSTKTGINDPYVRPTRIGSGKGNSSRRRTFYIEDEGIFDDDEGWWVVDDDTGEEGFLSQVDDVFYSPQDEWGTTWESANVVGRFLKRRKGKGKGKGGKKRRGQFRSRKEKGKAHMTDEYDWYYEPSQEEIWYEKEWGDKSLYGKGGKFNNRKGKGKYSKGKGSSKNMKATKA